MRTWIFSLGQRVDRVAEHAVYDELINRAVYAEELGYDGLFLAEHHFSNYSAIPYPLMLLAAASQRTERIRLGTAVVLLPLYNPMRLAEDVATLDNLSDGRAEVVVGRGYAALEFRGLDVDKSNSDSLMEEGLDILTKAWGQEEMDYQGKNWTIPTVTVIPRPFKETPPLWWAVGSKSSMASALDRDLNVICASAPGIKPGGHVDTTEAPHVDRMYSMYAQECSTRGIDPTGRRFGAQFAAHVSSDPSEVDRALAAAVWNHKLAGRLITDRQRIDRGFVDMSDTSDADLIDNVPRQVLDDHWMICDPQTFEKKVEKYREMGVTDLSLNVGFGGMDDAAVRRSMELIANVLQLRELV